VPPFLAAVAACPAVSTSALEGKDAGATGARLVFEAGTLTVERPLLAWDPGSALAGKADAGRFGSSLGALEEQRRVLIRERAPLSQDRWTALQRGTLSLPEALTALHPGELCRELVLQKKGVLNGVDYQGDRVVSWERRTSVPLLHALFDDGDRAWQWTAFVEVEPGWVRLQGSFTEFYTTLAHRSARRAIGG
jgi:hypothetical protein